MNQIFRVCGLSLQVARPLPYLPALAAVAGEPDVSVDFAPLPPLRTEKAVGPFHVHAPDLVDLVVPDRVAIRIAGGRSMTVAEGKSLEPGELQTYLLGPAFAVLLHQRGLPPLHAGAVRVGDRAVAIAGHSGAGKSTLVRALIGRRHRLLCDDQLVVEAASGTAHAGFPAMKLWGQSAALFGEATDGARRVRSDIEKYHFDAAAAFASQSAPLSVICAPVCDPSVSEPVAERLAIPQAVALLGGLSHYAHVADAMGGRAAIFHWAAALAARVPVYVIRRRQDLSGIQDLADRVLHLAARHGAVGCEVPS